MGKEKQISIHIFFFLQETAMREGFKYRGRGAIQLTGKDNYNEFAKFINDPERMINPDLLAVNYAFESALFYFDSRKIWKACDEGVNEDNI